MRRILWIPALLAIGLVGCRDEDITGTREGRPLLTQVSTGPVVNSLNDVNDATCDDTHCSLREAINFADAGATIAFAPGLTGTITLTGSLEIDKDLTITGPGAGSLSISGNNVVSPLLIVFAGRTVSISGLTFTGGNSSNSSAGIDNGGTLTLTRCGISGNQAANYGGGIYNWGTLTIAQSTISGNTAGEGGGIYNDSSAIVTLTRSTLSGNQATDFGGGIYNRKGTVTLTESTVSGSTANTGGAIRNRLGAVTVLRSTISGNSAGYGGGIESETILSDATQHLTILNSTISGNTATAGEGGGVYVFEGLTRIILSTITSNKATSGGGVFAENFLSFARVDVKGTLIWGNSLPDGTTPNDVALLYSVGSHYNSLGNNLIGAAGANVDFTQEFNAAGDATSVTNAVLGALADNGGPTHTHALLTGSPAINTGACTDHDAATVSTDQRGITRPQGAGCDKGAFEFEESSGLPAPNFTFVLPALTKTYGDGSFSVASYAASTNSTGLITLLTGPGSVGCSITLAGTVTLTGAATGTSACILEARIAADATYSSAGPISQSFQIAKASLTVTANDVTITYGATPNFGVGYSAFVGSDNASALGGTLIYTFAGAGGTSYGPSTTAPSNAGTYSITPSGYSSANYSFSYGAGTLTINRAAGLVGINNTPTNTHPAVGGSFTPTYDKYGDGTASTSSTTPAICTVSGGVVTFVAAGTCILQAAITEGTNHLAATGANQSFTVYPAFTSACTYTVNAKNGQRNVTVTWANAWPGVTQIQVSTTRTVQKAMLPNESASLIAKVPGGTPTYGIWGGTARRDISTVLVSTGTACTQTP